MRHNWLTPVERQYVQTLLDEAIEHVKLRDMKTCAAFVQQAIAARRMSKSMLIETKRRRHIRGAEGRVLFSATNVKSTWRV